MKKLALCLALAVTLTGCSLISLQDALAVLVAAKDVIGQVENWRVSVVEPTPTASNRAFEDRNPDILGLETLLVQLPGGDRYPLICRAEHRCDQFPPDTRLFLNKGALVVCLVERDGVTYRTCIDASELRREM